MKIKKIAIYTLLIFMISFSIKAYAVNEKVVVNVKVDGVVKKGETVTLKFDVENIQNLYGAQLEFLINTNKVKGESIELGTFISADKENLFEPFDKYDGTSDKIKGGFTYMGDVEGKSGSGNLFNIKLTLLEDKLPELNESDVVLKLVTRVDKEIGSSSYKLNIVKAEEAPKNEDKKPSEAEKPKEDKVEGSSSDQGSDKEDNSDKPTEENQSKNEDETKNELENNEDEANKDTTSNDEEKISLIPMVLAFGVLITIGYFVYKKKKK